MQGPSSQLCWLDRLVDLGSPLVCIGWQLGMHEMVVVHAWMMAGPALSGGELNSSAPLLSPACPVDA